MGQKLAGPQFKGFIIWGNRVIPKFGLFWPTSLGWSNLSKILSLFDGRTSRLLPPLHFFLPVRQIPYSWGL